MPRNSVSRPPTSAFTPTQRSPSNSSVAHLRVGGDRQVLAHARAGIEIADRRRHPPLIHIGNGDREIPVAELPVLVDQVFVAGRLECLRRCLGMLRPQVGEDPAHRDAAFIAVPWTIEVHVALDLLEERQHAVPVPSRRTARMPLVIVGRRTAVGELAVDRGPAAQHARLLIGAQRRPRFTGPVVRDDLGRDLQLRPRVGRIQIRGAGIGIEDRLRHLAVRRVLPRLQQQHLVRRCGPTAGWPAPSRRNRRRR